MTLTSLGPVLATLGFLAYVFLADRSPRSAVNWLVPALLSLAFLLFSLATVRREGLLGFWGNHTGSLWGNQVWFDLLFALAIAWTLILPRARKQGMLTLPWLLAICATGCIGFLAMLARLTYLELARKV